MKKKKRGANLNWFSREFRPTFGFALLAPSLLLIFLESLKLLQILWADTQFRLLYDYSQIGDRTRITGSKLEPKDMVTLILTVTKLL
jgi:hypothetical protein